MGSIYTTVYTILGKIARLRRNSRRLQKWWEGNFGGKLMDDSADTLGVNNFIEIALYRTISEINAFCVFYTEIQGGYQKSCTVFEINTFFAVYAEIQDDYISAVNLFFSL